MRVPVKSLLSALRLRLTAIMGQVKWNDKVKKGEGVHVPRPDRLQLRQRQRRSSVAPAPRHHVHIQLPFHYTEQRKSGGDGSTAKSIQRSESKPVQDDNHHFGC